MKKAIIYILLFLVIIAIALGIYGYSIISTGFDINKTTYIYIDKEENYNKLLKDIADSAKVKSISNFEMLASVLKYKNNLKSGRYAVKPGMNIYDFINDLRRGHQVPVQLKFNNIRTKDDLAERIGEQLMLDKDELLAYLNNSDKCRELGFNEETVISMFIPNTYEFYWDVNIDNFIQKIKKEYEKFWTDGKKNRAKEIGLSPVEVSILASIVEEESTYSDEYPMVAGLYMNRFKKGMLLQADPTVKFAIGDFSLRRILHKHLEAESPYNTYLNAGLPPGPIRIPSIKGLDAVLDYARHDYLYMCAKEDFSGYHNFAKTMAEHERNANRYRDALNKRKIYN